jgi:hypothetical protein
MNILQRIASVLDISVVEFFEAKKMIQKYIP